MVLIVGITYIIFKDKKVLSFSFTSSGSRKFQGFKICTHNYRSFYVLQIVSRRMNTCIQTHTSWHVNTSCHKNTCIETHVMTAFFVSFLWFYRRSGVDLTRWHLDFKPDVRTSIINLCSTKWLYTTHFWSHGNEGMLKIFNLDKNIWPHHSRNATFKLGDHYKPWEWEQTKCKFYL